MSITITGPHGGKPYNNAIAQKIQSAVIIMSTKLGIAHVPTEFDIAIGRTVDKLDGDSEGWCFARQLKKNKRWEVSIFLQRKKHFKDMIIILAHELIHAKQFIKDGLDVNSSEFKGKKFSAKNGQSNYWHSPWEKDAYAKQGVLAEYYFNYIKKNT